MHRFTCPARLCLVLFALLSGGACVSLDQAAPPAETLSAQMRLGTPSQLAQGRLIYVTKCAACHSVEPVHKYSAERWEHEILPEMVEETNLNAAEVAAVRAYVLTVLNHPSPGGGPSGSE